jgi:DNA helicase-2/ATP-dependent DNA helicase PcrA
MSTWGDKPRPAGGRPPVTSNVWGNSSGRPGQDERRLPPPNTAGDPPRRERPTTARYKTGQKVRHAKFGDGTVIESKVTGSDEEVVVAFPGLGIKRLAASIAALEIIE